MPADIRADGRIVERPRDDFVIAVGTKNRCSVPRSSFLWAR